MDTHDHSSRGTLIKSVSAYSLRTGSFIITVMLLLGFLFWPPDVDSQEPNPQIEVGVSYSDLDNNFEDWNEEYVKLKKPSGNQSGFFGEINRTYWFNQSDVELSGGAYGPLSEDIDARGEIVFSPTHKVAPSLYTSGQLTYWLENGFEAIVGTQFSEYNRSDDSTGLLTGIRFYEFPYWIGYTYAPAWLGEAGPANSHTFSAGYQGQNQNNLGISATHGESNTEIAAGQIRQEDITSVSVWGEQPLTSDLFLTLQGTWDNIDNLYDRINIKAGIGANF